MKEETSSIIEEFKYEYHVDKRINSELFDNVYSVNINSLNTFCEAIVINEHTIRLTQMIPDLKCIEYAELEKPYFEGLFDRLNLRVLFID